MGTYLKAIILIIILLFLITFGVKNNQPIRLYYYLNIETFEISLYGLVYLSIIIGIIIGMIIGISTRLSLRRKVKQLQRQNRDQREGGGGEKGRRAISSFCDRGRREASVRGLMMKPKTIVLLVLIVLFVIILIQNTQVVTLRLFFWKIGMSQIILIPLTMLIGLVIGYIVAQVTGNRHKDNNHK